MNNLLTTENQKLQQETVIQSRPTRRPRDYQQISLIQRCNPLDWEDWHWQIKHRIRTKEELAQIIKLTPEEEEG